MISYSGYYVNNILYPVKKITLFVQRGNPRHGYRVVILVLSMVRNNTDGKQEGGLRVLHKT